MTSEDIIMAQHERIVQLYDALADLRQFWADVQLEMALMGEEQHAPLRQAMQVVMERSMSPGATVPWPPTGASV